MVTSQFVIDEASQGRSELAAERLDLLKDIPILGVQSDVTQIADELLRKTVLPVRARLDALHIAVAAFHEVDYILTWNCAHIANARILPRIREVLSGMNYSTPIICTPEEMTDEIE